jgi:hypothetical protein
LLQPLPTAAGARMMKLNFERLKFLKQRGHPGFAMFSLRFEPNSVEADAQGTGCPKCSACRSQLRRASRRRRG